MNPSLGDTGSLDLGALSEVIDAPEAKFRHDYLEVRDLTVSFDGFIAVDAVSLSVTQGDLRFLIGPNGAGKTTIIDALTGLVSASGSARFAEKDLLNKKPNKIVHQGVGRTFQTASVIEELSVLQNLDIAEGFKRNPLFLLGRRRGVSETIERTLEVIGLDSQAHQPAGTLAHGQKQWLEIGMLLVQDAHLLLLDEPVAGMSLEEREETGLLLRRIGEQRTVVVVEHDMEFMRAFAQSVTVLHQGKVLAEGSVDDIHSNAKVVEVYLGSEEGNHA